MGMSWVGYRRDQDFVDWALFDEALVDSLVDDARTELSVDIDEAWHGIHWLLTGSSEPNAALGSLVIFGGQPIGEDQGYGPYQLLSVAQVARVAEFLERLDVDAIRVLIDPTAMTHAGVYPMIWDRTDIFEDYLLPHYVDLRAFYQAAAAASEAVLRALA